MDVSNEVVIHSSSLNDAAIEGQDQNLTKSGLTEADKGTSTSRDVEGLCKIPADKEGPAKTPGGEHKGPPHVHNTRDNMDPHTDNRRERRTSGDIDNGHSYSSPKTGMTTLETTRYQHQATRSTSMTHTLQEWRSGDPDHVVKLRTKTVDDATTVTIIREVAEILEAVGT